MGKPSPNQYPEFFQKYIDLVKEDSLNDAFSNQSTVVNAFFASLTESQSLLSYAPGKWSIREVLQHIIDTERVFSYRTLCIARGEAQNLPSFDEVQYATNANGAERRLQDLVEEFYSVRKSTELLFGGLSEANLLMIGKVNNKFISPIALGYISVGHVYHHFNIIEQRYLGR